MLRILTIISIFLVGCSNSDTPNNYEVIVETEKSSIVELPKPVEKAQPKIDLEFFVGKTFLSGTVHQLYFIDTKNLSITFERYYDGSWGKHTIRGKFKVLNGSDLKVDWFESNTITWFNTWGECDMQTVKQSESFSDIMNFNFATNCFTISSVFQQSYYAGNRCGNEDKSNNSNYEFCLN